MADLVEEMEQAVSLYIRGRADEAVEVGRDLLPRARGTPHAASVFRHMAEFLHAVGNYQMARATAQEAGALARALRHPGEMLGAQLVGLACDLYEGQVAAVYKQLGDLVHMASGQPTIMLFAGKVMLTAGNLDEALDTLDRTRTELDELSEPGLGVAMELFGANLLVTVGKAELLAGRPDEAAAVLERAMAFDLPTLVPGTLARAMLGLALVQIDQPEQGLELLSQACGLARKIANHVHGHALALTGLARRDLGDLDLATEQLRSALGLITHTLERQEGFCALGEICRMLGEDGDAVEAFRRATEPTTDSLFGRTAVRSLRELVGLRVL